MYRCFQYKRIRGVRSKRKNFLEKAVQKKLRKDDLNLSVFDEYFIKDFRYINGTLEHVINVKLFTLQL